MRIVKNTSDNLKDSSHKFMFSQLSWLLLICIASSSKI